MTDCTLIFHGRGMHFTSIKTLHAFVVKNGDQKKRYLYSFRADGDLKLRTIYYRDGWKLDTGEFNYRLNPDGTYSKKTTDDIGVKWYYTINGFKLSGSLRTSANIARKDGYSRSYGKGTLDTDIIEIWKVYKDKHALAGRLDRVDGRWVYFDCIEERWYLLDVESGRIRDI